MKKNFVIALLICKIALDNFFVPCTPSQTVGIYIGVGFGFFCLLTELEDAVRRKRSKARRQKRLQAEIKRLREIA